MQCEATIKFAIESFENFLSWFEANGNKKKVRNLFIVNMFEIEGETASTCTVNIIVETVNDEYISDIMIAGALFSELGIFQAADNQISQSYYPSDMISFDLQENKHEFIRKHRPRRFNGSFKDMDCDFEDTSDLTYIEGNQLNNRKIAYPFSFSSSFREKVFSDNQKLYAPELEQMVNEINSQREDSGLWPLNLSDYVICENDQPECNGRICIINKIDADLDHDPSLSERFNSKDHDKDLYSRMESFFDINRIFIMHKSCNRSKGGIPYNKTLIEKIWRNEHQ